MHANDRHAAATVATDAGLPLVKQIALLTLAAFALTVTAPGSSQNLVAGRSGAAGNAIIDSCNRIAAANICPVTDSADCRQNRKICPVDHATTSKDLAISIRKVPMETDLVDPGFPIVQTARRGP